MHAEKYTGIPPEMIFLHTHNSRVLVLTETSYIQYSYTKKAPSTVYQQDCARSLSLLLTDDFLSAQYFFDCSDCSIFVITIAGNSNFRLRRDSQ